MSSSLRRGALAATVLALPILTVAGCGVGSNAQTLEVKPDNAATAVGVIKIQNVSVITQPQRDAKGPAVISATLFNNGRTDQTLQTIRLSGTGATAQLKPAKGRGPLTIPAGGSVLLGGKGNASAVLTSGRQAVTDGNVQPLTFTFSKTGDVQVKSFVVPARNYFSKYGPSNVPTPSTTPSGSPTGSATPTGGATASGAPSGSPSGSASGAAGSGATGSGTAGSGAPSSSETATAGR
ncbi:copper chaperone PCu(A)C [Streptomyces odontomachi]|uniref:copper chaperone PCu(A)C n=1 Tax=Streptomyces odontomachi TaxID=2944940 RepID=UPI0021097BDB|nr:copper chaperone PCu(A)C [Streptomyces sp. ODS25]